MKEIYALIIVGGIVVVFWYILVGLMIYQMGKDAGLWTYIMSWINRWIQWRYGFGQ